jgi:DNA invertase Pin-like site-specific DNA recombinase
MTKEERRLAKIENVKRTLRLRKDRGLNVGRPRTYDRHKIIELRKTGLSVSEIVGVVKCSRATICRILKPKPTGDE